MPVGIASTLYDYLRAEAVAHPGEEICGLLFGDATRIDDARQCRNVSASPGDSFEIDPAALIAVHRVMRTGGARMIGCYHSHPYGPAMPSARDIAAAEAGALWLIITRDEMRAWRATAADGAAVRFDEVTLRIE